MYSRVEHNIEPEIRELVGEELKELVEWLPKGDYEGPQQMINLISTFHPENTFFTDLSVFICEDRGTKKAILVKYDSVVHLFWGERNALKYLLKNFRWQRHGNKSLLMGPFSKTYLDTLRSIGGISFYEEGSNYRIDLNEEILQEMKQRLRDLLPRFKLDTMRKADLRKFKTMWKYYPQYEDTFMERVISDGRNSCVRNEKGLMIATVSIKPEGSLGMLYVDEYYRRLGLAEIVVVDLLEKELRRSGKEEYTCFIEIISDNVASQSFFRKVGFEKIEQNNVCWAELVPHSLANKI